MHIQLALHVLFLDSLRRSSREILIQYLISQLNCSKSFIVLVFAGI